ncbi:transposase [Candidatus Venteria ishoeyi]|uniref:Transposase IS116/IS110/IS902 family protein n=1 Tax=Candidatus Venteria ishoeyi TaxID=1899563 RepID=A0A1H6FDY4_9GAMM|nr:transposase [Candidatus Venteria ishoeyi]SEH08272.1 Transposase IS116/IS110/IS902 family protein [Candidatus Venteria ishoeyi]
MKKHTYRQIDVNNINWTKIRAQAENRDLHFCVDVAKQKFVGLLVTADSEIICLLKWTHPQDTLGLVERLCNGLGVARLEVVMEPSGTYGDVLRWQFTKRGIPVYRVGTKPVHDRAESYDGVPSLHDSKAAHIIAELHREGHSALWQETPAEQRNLRGLTAELEIQQQLHRANLNRLSALMARYYPELECVVDLSSISVLTLLSQYGTPSEIVIHEEDAATLLEKVGGYFLKTDKRLAILQSAHDSLGVPCVPGEQGQIKALAKDLLRTHQASMEVEKHMAQALKADEGMTNMADVTGKVTCIVLAAILGDLKKYANAASLLKALGLNLRERSSGKHQGQLKITKRGSGKARFYLYWLVMRLVQHDQVIKTWYERKVARDGGRFKGRALIAVMRKVVKGLWHVARGEKFDSSKLFNLA